MKFASFWAWTTGMQCELFKAFPCHRESLLVINKCTTAITDWSSRTFRFYSDNKFDSTEVFNKKSLIIIIIQHNFTTTTKQSLHCLQRDEKLYIRSLDAILMGIVGKTIINIAFQTHIIRTWCLAYEHFSIFLKVRQLPILFFLPLCRCFVRRLRREVQVPCIV